MSTGTASLVRGWFGSNERAKIHLAHPRLPKPPVNVELGDMLMITTEAELGRAELSPFLSRAGLL